MSRLVEMGQREELRTRRKIIAAEVQSHRDSLLSALSIIHPIDELEGEYIAALGIKMNNLLIELKVISKRIVILIPEQCVFFRKNHFRNSPSSLPFSAAIWEIKSRPAVNGTAL